MHELKAGLNGDKFAAFRGVSEKFLSLIRFANDLCTLYNQLNASRLARFWKNVKTWISYECVMWIYFLTRYFVLSLYLHQTLKRTILSEIWVMNFFPKPLEKDKRSKSENFRRLNENVSEMAARWTGDYVTSKLVDRLCRVKSCLYRFLASRGGPIILLFRSPSVAVRKEGRWLTFYVHSRLNCWFSVSRHSK